MARVRARERPQPHRAVKAILASDPHVRRRVQDEHVDVHVQQLGKDGGTYWRSAPAYATRSGVLGMHLPPMVAWFLA